MKEFVFQVSGMMCGMCESHVNDAMRKLGANKVSSSHAKKQTVVTAEEFDIEAAKSAIRALGYEVSDEVEIREAKKKFSLFGK